MLLRLRGDGDERRTCGSNLLVNFLDGAQLRVAVCAPASAIENDSERTAPKQVFRTPKHAVAVREFEAGCALAGLERTVRQSGVNKFLSRQIYHSQPLGGNHGAQLGGERVELLVERQEIW